MAEVFQSFWVGSTLSPYEAVAMRSFVDHGHRFRLYCFSNRLRVPKGVELADASEILPLSQCFSYRQGFGAGSYSACSNLFRYMLLSQRGGWWVDTDVVCLGTQMPGGKNFFAREDDDFVNGAVLRFEQDDELLKACLAEALALGQSVRWGEVGPRLITRKARELGRLSEAQPSSTCYPVHWSNALDVLDPLQTERLLVATAPSDMLHLWNEIYRQAKVSKQLLPPAGSFLRILADRHPVGGWRGEYFLPASYEPADLAANLMHHGFPAMRFLKNWAIGQFSLSN